MTLTKGCEKPPFFIILDSLCRKAPECLLSEEEPAQRPKKPKRLSETDLMAIRHKNTGVRRGSISQLEAVNISGLKLFPQRYPGLA